MRRRRNDVAVSGFGRFGRDKEFGEVRLHVASYGFSTGKASIAYLCSSMEFFSVDVHYGGSLEGDPPFAYHGGLSASWENCDIDKWSCCEIKDCLEELGVVDYRALWLEELGVVSIHRKRPKRPNVANCICNSRSWNEGFLELVLVFAHWGYWNCIKQGLLLALDELLPGVDQRFCVRHLYNNFRKKFPGIQLKNLMWNAAKATYRQEWERAMLEIRKVNEAAYQYLMQIPPRHWTKSAFTLGPKSDQLLNNMCETFNSVILKAREKPIVTMIEEIKVYLIERWAKNRKDAEKLPSQGVLPKIRKRLEKEFKESGKWLPRWAGEKKYEAQGMQATSEGRRVKLRARRKVPSQGEEQAGQDYAI
ncbi:Sporozoite surface protein 2 [Senna tora]|uniref:Sporozoite surface protein 2 n=1 Tax=Senna tora TaxID=362788 RepID=A0A834WS53_9FABA|nr:Sporozoite surface protein 2 [Senna tora]